MAVPVHAAPADLGDRLELFVDEALVANTKGVEFVLHAPIQQPMAKSPLPVRHMITILKDGDLFRAYWRGTDSSVKDDTKDHSGRASYVVHYAESKDGHEWTFPSLGLHEVEGTRDNNVILAMMPPLLENFSPFIDSRPGVDPSEKYKALAGYPGPGDKRELRGNDLKGKGLHAFTSPDGIHWTHKGEVIPYQPGWRHAFDSQNVSFWSEAEGQYVCYFRTWTAPERLRSVSRTTSKDFVSWTEPVDMNPNLPGEHLYTTQTHPYFRAPHIYIAMPTRFNPGVGTAPEYAPKDVNTTDIRFMTTRAGSTTFDRPFKGAFIRPGLDPNRWGNRANYVALNAYPTGPTEMSIHHRSGHRYTLRTDGFVSATAGYEEGTLITTPITFTGESLVLNVSTAASGKLRVALEEPDGTAIPGFTLDECNPVIGDEIERVVSWTGGQSLASLAGKPVRLRFVMNETDLYSYRFR